jgi:hypothetical protein
VQVLRQEFTHPALQRLRFLGQTVAGNVDLVQLVEHADVSTTLRTYVHSTEGATRRAAQAMGAGVTEAVR